MIRGVLCQAMATGVECGEIVMNLGGQLRNFVKPRKLGRTFGSDAWVCLERGLDTVREPDIAYITAEKVPPGTPVRGSMKRSPI